MNQVTAAGVIVYKSLGSGRILFLGLHALPQFQTKNNGFYDIPKGRIDPGENALQTARREAYEEASLTITNFEEGPFIHDKLTVWLTECHQEPQIGVNPSTGIQEHLGFSWIKPAVLEAQCLDYLKPHVRWARRLIEG